MLSIATLAIAVVFALRSPFDEQHQRRLFVLSSDDVRDFSLPRRSLGKGLSVCARVVEWVPINRSLLTNDTFMSGLPMAHLDLNNWSTTLLPTLVWLVRRPFKRICTIGMGIGISYTRFQL